MRAALQEIMRHVHPFSRPWFSYLPPQDVHCNEFPTTADFWYDVHTRKTTTDHDPRRRTDQCNLHMHVNSNENKSPLKNTRSPFPTHVTRGRGCLGAAVFARARGGRARARRIPPCSRCRISLKRMYIPFPVQAWRQASRQAQDAESHTVFTHESRAATKYLRRTPPALPSACSPERAT